jgi:hypothetical protein
MLSGFCDPGGGTEVDDNCKDCESGGIVRNASNCGNGNNDEDDDNDDGVVDGPAIFAHTELAKTVREYPCPFYFFTY